MSEHVKSQAPSSKSQGLPTPNNCRIPNEIRQMRRQPARFGLWDCAIFDWELGVVGIWSLGSGICRRQMKSKTVFACQECGAQSPKWLGRCADCGAWNSLVEERQLPERATAGAAGRAALQPGGDRRAAALRGHRHGRRRAAHHRRRRIRSRARRRGRARARWCCSAASRASASPRCCCRRRRISREPSARSSTAPARSPSTRSSRAASGSASTLRRARGRRRCYILAETCLERILEEIARLRPAFIIVDSVQTVFSLKFQSAPGSIGQVRESATQLLFAAKGQNIPTFLVGHVTKDGSLAGPKALEHIVDTVLYFEGEKHHAHRVIRAVKNRFGAVSELGVFEMTGRGLRGGGQPVRSCFSPSAVPARPAPRCSACVEGSRPLLVEVQALVSSSTYGNARRMASGIDQNRLSLLLAVLEKRAGLNLIADDVFVNVARGHRRGRAGGGSGDHRRGRLEPAQPADSRRHGGVRRGRSGRRSARRFPGGAAGARSCADGLHALRRPRRQLFARGRAGRASSSSA